MDGMDCQKCGQKSANVHIVQEINGKHHELFLCSDCAKKYDHYGVGFSLGLDSGLQFAFNNFLPGFIGHTKNVVSTTPKELLCKECGLAFGEFQKLGRLGCGNCYETFQEELAPILSRIHGNVAYRGKKPDEKMEQGKGKRTEEDKVLETLKQELQECISKEEYERAAKIRDEIRKADSRKNDGNGGGDRGTGV
jgi:protein arginine kinase activator